MHKGAENDSIKCELEGPLYFTLKGVPKISLKVVLKNAQKNEEKDACDLIVDGLFCGAFDSAPEGVPKYVLNDVRKGAQESTIKFESKQNIVNGLIF